MQAPLEGIRVLDLSQMWAVPGAGMYLADMGAEVIKVEPPWGDDARRTFTQPPIPGGESRSFLVVNRNKRGIALDVTSPEGREVVYSLVRRSDVLLHNFRPGVAERLGYGYETLRQLNPRLIYVAATPFGERGPYARRPGYDLLFQSLAGLLSKRRMPDGTPISSGIWVADCSAPILLAYGVALALLVREKTGQGQRVETSLLNMAIAMQSVDLVRVEREEPSPQGGDFSAQAMYSPYRCADGKWLIIVVVNDRQFQGLCRALELEHLVREPRFSTPLKRAQNSQELYELLEGIFSTRPREEWLRRLEVEDVPCAPILERGEVFEHPQIRENDMILRVEHPLAGWVEMMNIPLRLSLTPGSLRRPAPTFGQHTDEVLLELGYSWEAIEELRRKGVVR
jgi:crotonobetainyl-CoA:carnitine CoA-transferase CaiB-like acyl-CoA transferase